MTVLSSFSWVRNFFLRPVKGLNCVSFPDCVIIINQYLTLQAMLQAVHRINEQVYLCIKAQEVFMEFKTMYYVVESVDGDYANLRRTDEPADEPMLVARALLPADIVEGTKLKYEMLQYEIIK